MKDSLKCSPAVPRYTMCTPYYDSAAWSQSIPAALSSTSGCAKCAARAVADALQLKTARAAGSSVPTMGGLSAPALCATARTSDSAGVGDGAGALKRGAGGEERVGRKRARRARTKAKDRTMIPHPTDPTRVHIHCINMCGVLYLTKTRDADKVAWTKVLRRLNAHESKRCRKKKPKLSAAAHTTSSAKVSAAASAVAAAKQLRAGAMELGKLGALTDLAAANAMMRPNLTGAALMRTLQAAHAARPALADAYAQRVRQVEGFPEAAHLEAQLAAQLRARLAAAAAGFPAFPPSLTSTSAGSGASSSGAARSGRGFHSC